MAIYICSIIVTTTTTNSTTPTDDPQIPQPDLRFVKEKANQTKQTAKTGQEPNKNTHKQNRCCLHSGNKPTVLTQNNTCEEMKSSQTNYKKASAVGQVKPGTQPKPECSECLYTQQVYINIYKCRQLPCSLNIYKCGA